MGREPMPASPMMMAKGGEVFEIDDPATMEEASMAQEAVMADPNADLRGADLWGAILIGADLRGAKLNGVVLDFADLEQAKFCNTTMSDGSIRNDDC